jgi:Cu+-exporting ATPase
VAEGSGPGPTGPAERAHCFHCGEPCIDLTFTQAEKVFCCQGCLVVHDLLAENGLEHFYNLGRHPGVRVRRSSKRDQWTYLDEPALQGRLLDFTNGKISRITLRIPAIHCVACVWLLENLFRLRPGIGRSTVHFLRREAAIEFDPDKIKLSELVALLVSIGYEPALTLGELEKGKPDSLRKRQWIQVGVAGFAFGNIMLFSLPGYLGLDSFSAPVFKPLFSYLSLALALPVLIYSASDYWRSARLSLRRRVLTLDVPIALGLAALYAQSAYEVFSGRGAGYLDSLVGLVFFLLCGRAFQQRTHDRLVFDRDYKSFFPLSVMRRTAGGEESVAISNLRVGDRIILRNGELIPADAKLVGGTALIDYSFVTGESEPAGKREGDYLYAGGKQAGGVIDVEIVKPVSQSYLTSLWSHEAFQKDGDDNLGTLTNLYSRRFTRVVVSVAMGAALFWFASGDPARAIKAFTSVLIVACPCALALAAPFTLGTAQRRLARLGVFLRKALVIERMARVNTIVFDKTGTLTTPSTGTVSFQGEPLSTAEERRVCSLARQSTHPHCLRINELLAPKCFPETVHLFRETPGCGVEGIIGGHDILLGSAAWLESRGVRSAALGATTAKNGRGMRHSIEDVQRNPLPLGAAALHGSTVHIAIDGRLRGTFALTSTLRPGIGCLLRDLGQHYEIALLSGDNGKEREHFGRWFAGHSRLNFSQSPLDKLGFVQRLQRSGRTVMMVGDGLNDAGALKQSDVGIAVVERIGAFSPASDVILEGIQVPRLFEILTLARSAAWIVRLSFGLSALYNLAGIGIAAAGILSPLVCAVLMPVSSISVVLFACGLTHWTARRIFGSAAQTSGPDAGPNSESTGVEVSDLTAETHGGLKTGDAADLGLFAAKEATA